MFNSRSSPPNVIYAKFSNWPESLLFQRIVRSCVHWQLQYLFRLPASVFCFCTHDRQSALAYERHFVIEFCDMRALTLGFVSVIDGNVFEMTEKIE